MISKIIISVSEQRLIGVDEFDRVVMDASISTGVNGTGQVFGSECTPLGEHRVRAKIGGDQSENTVFSGRRPTGEVYSEKYAKHQPNRDWVLSRILWLCGNELGFNRGGNVDTQRRFIYIHGTPDSHEMGLPRSHGCIRMRNRDIIALFDKVPVGTIVDIEK